jgi:phospho-N-acetylmuramoyl-pentapeptide-transferase
MGGLIFAVASLIAVIPFLPAEGRFELITVIMLGIGFGLIGFIDDFLKVVRHRSLGLRAREKTLGQMIVGLLFLILIARLGVSTIVRIPFTETAVSLGVLYWPLILILVAYGGSNAVNLTDGIDGLASSTTIIAFLAYAYICVSQGRWALAIYVAALIGALAAFLVFNHHPAKVFMGDIGSFFLGGILAGLAVVTKTELYLVIIGGVFVAEAVSVMLQVVYFRLTGGKRLFKMSPLHHHFELSGWSEGTVWAVWCTAGIILAAIGLLAL